MRNSFSLLLLLLIVGCSSPPSDELRDKAKTIAKQNKVIQVFDSLYSEEQFQNQKFALFRAYSGVKGGYEMIVSGKIKKREDDKAPYSNNKISYSEAEFRRELIEEIRKLNKNLEILCGQH